MAVCLFVQEVVSHIEELHFEERVKKHRHMRLSGLGAQMGKRRPSSHLYVELCLDRPAMALHGITAASQLWTEAPTVTGEGAGNQAQLEGDLPQYEEDVDAGGEGHGHCDNETMENLREFFPRTIGEHAVSRTLERWMGFNHVSVMCRL